MHCWLCIDRKKKNVTVARSRPRSRHEGGAEMAPSRKTKTSVAEVHKFQVVPVAHDDGDGARSRTSLFWVMLASDLPNSRAVMWRAVCARLQNRQH